MKISASKTICEKLTAIQTLNIANAIWEYANSSLAAFTMVSVSSETVGDYETLYVHVVENSMQGISDLHFQLYYLGGEFRSAHNIVRLTDET